LAPSLAPAVAGGAEIGMNGRFVAWKAVYLTLMSG